MIKGRKAWYSVSLYEVKGGRIVLKGQDYTIDWVVDE